MFKAIKKLKEKDHNFKITKKNSYIYGNKDYGTLNRVPAVHVRTFPSYYLRSKMFQSRMRCDLS